MNTVYLIIGTYQVEHQTLGVFESYELAANAFSQIQDADYIEAWELNAIPPNRQPCDMPPAVGAPRLTFDQFVQQSRDTDKMLFRVDWPAECDDWRQFVPDTMRQLWPQMTPTQRYTAFCVADRQAALLPTAV